jgi:hypothetical protein
MIKGDRLLPGGRGARAVPPSRTRRPRPTRLDVAAITQEDPTQPRENWQAPYDERLLTPEGDADQEASWPIRPEILRGDVRLVVAVPEPSARPQRFAWLDYEEP